MAPATRATKPTALPPILLVATPVDLGAVDDVLLGLRRELVDVGADDEIVIVDGVVVAGIVEFEDEDAAMETVSIDAVST